MTDYLIPPIHADMLHESRYSCNLNYNPTHFYQERIISTSLEGPSRMGLVRILELGHFMLHLVVTRFKHFIKSNYFCSPSTIG